ncbi:MAG: hypothetical protein ACXVZH_02545 [Terriglobales bacterium]
MESWASLQHELLPRGFHAAVFASIRCPEHGLFRLGIAYGITRQPCPTCGNICRPRFLALGLTRRPLPVIEQSNGVKLKAPIGAKYVRLVQVTPAGSKFEREVKRRKLTLDDQESLLASAALRRWAERHRFRHFIPEQLLTAWHLPVPEARVPDIALD